MVGVSAKEHHSTTCKLELYMMRILWRKEMHLEPENDKKISHHNPSIGATLTKTHKSAGISTYTVVAKKCRQLNIYCGGIKVQTK